jgi:hypothetical protein
MSQRMELFMKTLARKVGITVKILPRKWAYSTDAMPRVLGLSTVFILGGVILNDSPDSWIWRY